MTSQLEHRYFFVRETMIPVGIIVAPGRNAKPDLKRPGFFDAQRINYTH